LKTESVITFFSTGDDSRGAKTKITKLLGLSSGAISQWGEVVPEGQAYKLESLTKGRLKVDSSLYQKK
jgi:transcriptional repressor of cell division inhibition gene dicB